MAIRVFKKINENVSIFSKFIIFSLLIVAVPILLLNIVFYVNIQNVYEMHLNETYAIVANKYLSGVNYKLSIYESLMENITMNNVVLDMLTKQDTYKQKDIVDIGKKFSAEINSILSGKTRSEIHRLTIYAMNEEFPSDGIYISNISYVKHTQWYQEITAGSKNTVFISMPIEGSDENTVSIIKRVYNRDSKEKTLYIMKLDLLASQIFSTAEDFSSELVVNSFDGSHNLVFASKGQIIDSKSHKYIKLSSELYEKNLPPNWEVQLAFSNLALSNYLREYNFLIVFSNIVLILFLTVGIIIFARLITRRLGKLVRKIENVDSEPIDLGEPLGGRDEIAVIDQQLSFMVARVNTLIEENYKRELEKREANIRALQFQIQPHFLYNTLESINQIAAFYKCPEICTISQNLGEMYRYSINENKGDYVQFKEEFQHVCNFVRIQEVRFPDLFQFFYDIPEEITDMYMLRFIMQPIVENAFKHALVECGGDFEIVAGTEDGCLVIHINDTGVGITEEVIEDLNETINAVKSSSKSIGMRNVNQRIKLTHGEKYGISINSRVGIGTSVIIRLPIITEI